MSSEPNSDIDIEIVSPKSSTYDTFDDTQPTMDQDSQATGAVDAEIDDTQSRSISNGKGNDKDSAVAPSSAVAPVDDDTLLTKETRKLRKKKQFISDDEDDTNSKAKKKSTGRQNKSNKGSDSQETAVKLDDEAKEEEMAVKLEDMEVDGELHQEKQEKGQQRKKISYTDFDEKENDIDDVDTDDLLDHVEQLPQLRKGPTKRKKILTKKKSISSSSTRNTGADILRKFVKKKPEGYDPEKVKKYASEYPDDYWKFHADSGYDMIDNISEDNPVVALPYAISDQGAITGMTLSGDGTLLATFSNIGSIKVWDVAATDAAADGDESFKLLRHIRDKDEKQIDEFYCGQILENEGLIVAGGKLKDRYRWSAEDNDSHILPCPLKIFDVVTGKRTTLLEGHAEEILCIKAIQFLGENYLISTSQDGYIIKWHMDSTWTKLLESTRMDDGLTCMAFTVSFVPNTGNKYFIAACDEHLRLYDFEQATLLQTFEDLYSSYCDCGKFVNWLDAPPSISDMEKQVKDLTVNDEEGDGHEKEQEAKIVIDKDEGTGHNRQIAWFISRGAEMCDVSEGVSSKPNTCTLHKLIYPTEKDGKFELETVRRYTDEEYHSNSWLVKITSNGRYILAPTIYGQIFVFNMATGQVTAIIKEHEDIEVRDVIFHPYKPLIFSCGDGKCLAHSEPLKCTQIILLRITLNNCTDSFSL
ncbi:WD40-repeat-containing domain protein [Mycotypha africana]|uniref:WD40-repeat-containing domain protein n=1 Tax=Mycotypha africana TaxID=64632 RepID=UPI0023019F75|nr:WD40-repeat-containing domain protein [Mycotypha africana]KAI8967594.1 WD40-repeat-containing domain protein [Mycotypha africana]